MRPVGTSQLPEELPLSYNQQRLTGTAAGTDNQDEQQLSPVQISDSHKSKLKKELRCDNWFCNKNLTDNRLLSLIYFSLLCLIILNFFNAIMCPQIISFDNLTLKSLTFLNTVTPKLHRWDQVLLLFLLHYS